MIFGPPLHTFSPILNQVLSTSIYGLFESAEPTVSRVTRVINSIVLVYTSPPLLPSTLPLCYNVVPLPHRRVPFVYPSQFQPQFQRQLDVCLVPLPGLAAFGYSMVLCVCVCSGGEPYSQLGSFVRLRLHACLHACCPPTPPPNNKSRRFIWDVEWNQLHGRAGSGRQRRQGRQAEWVPHTPTHTSHPHTHTHGVVVFLTI